MIVQRNCIYTTQICLGCIAGSVVFSPNDQVSLAFPEFGILEHNPAVSLLFLQHCSLVFVLFPSGHAFLLLPAFLLSFCVRMGTVILDAYHF